MTNIRNDSSYLRDDLRRSLAHRRAYRIRRNDKQEEASRRYSIANGSLIRVEGPSKSRSDDRTSFLLARGTASKKRSHRLSSTERASERSWYSKCLKWLLTREGSRRVMYTRGCGIFSHTRTCIACLCARALGTLIEGRCKGPKGQRKGRRRERERKGEREKERQSWTGR